MVGNIVPHGCYLLLCAHIGFAYFHKASARAEAAHAGVCQVTDKEVEHHVDALAFCCFHDACLKVRIARGKDVLYTHGAQQGSLGVRSGSGQDFCPPAPGYLYGSQAHAACG